MDTARARRWQGLRQDSGDPYVFAPRAKEIYESLGIDYREKMIIFSDALNLEKALKLKKQCDEIGFKFACCSPMFSLWRRGVIGRIRNGEFVHDRSSVIRHRDVLDERLPVGV